MSKQFKILLIIVICANTFTHVKSYFCDDFSKNLTYKFYPLRHCQRSNKTIIGQANFKDVIKCMEFTRSRKGMAFNFSPANRGRRNQFDIEAAKRGINKLVTIVIIKLICNNKLVIIGQTFL